MRKYYRFLFLLPLLLPAVFFAQAGSPEAWRDKVAPELRAAFDRGEPSDFLVILRERADLSGAAFIHGKSQKARFVFDRLRATAERSQVNVRRILKENQGTANSFYLVNALAVEGGKGSLAKALAGLPEVAYLAADPWVHFDEPIPEPAEAAERNTIEWGVSMINAPQVWDLGYQGQGITVGGADTGYDWTHPAIHPHYRGWNGIDSVAEHNYNWYDAIKEPDPHIPDTLVNPCGIDIDQPCDDFGHGTHTMGTMTGDDGQGNQIGVAPAAKWIGCRNMDRGNGRPSTYIGCWQWFLAPTNLDDEDPDPTQAPHVINNSWYCSVGEGCTDLSVNELLRQAMLALQASGVVVVISNGNFGPNCGTTYGPPAYFEESFSIGATRMDDSIAAFSSRGPVLIDSSFRQKPNVSAPGQNVRSCTPNNNYANYSGTSMAGPHVAGLVALMLSARPDLAGEVGLIQDIIEQTAIPKTDTSHCGIPGDSRPNMAFGWGRVDALAAVNAALLVPVIEPSGKQELSANVMPNPVQEEAIFEMMFPSGRSGAADLDIFAANGARVYFRKWLPEGQRDIVRVSLGQLPGGVYLWRLSTSGGAVAGKLVKN